MNVKIVIRRIDKSPLEETKILSFSFVKDAYTPYTSLHAKIYSEEESYMAVCEVLFYVNDRIVHHGLIDSLENLKSGSGSIISLSSRGFTSLLCQNQIAPGMITGISINSLIDGYYNFPYVTHEDNSDSSGYIFVKSNSTMWDGVVNLAYKHTGIYPYIRETNCVRITAEQNPSVFTYADDQLIESGLEYNYKRMISNFHMSDISGDFGTYELKDSVVADRKIVRHKFFEMDRQFLYEPQAALEYRDKYCRRGSFCYKCRYSGYNGEDLADLISFGDVVNKRIGRVEITGDSSGILTELSVYYDGFFVNGTL